MNARVPSIGSNTHRYRASPRSSPNSSPNTPCSGYRPARTARIACSAVRSATVTGLASPFSSAPTPARNHGRITAPATSAAEHAAATNPSILLTPNPIPMTATRP